mgnify:CR=1 FL=1
MQCPKCQYKFKFKQIPVENRFLKAGYTIFLCNNCEELLSPDKRYIIFMNSGLCLLTAGSLFIPPIFNIPYLAIALVALGLFFSIFAHQTMKAVIYEGEL